MLRHSWALFGSKINVSSIFSCLCPPMITHFKHQFNQSHGTGVVIKPAFTTIPQDDFLNHKLGAHAAGQQRS